MVKSVFKEIIIVLLLIVIIILLLGILFYDYIPTSKVVPSKVQEYALEETVKQELDKELNNLNSEEIVKTYKLDATDIAHYEKTNEYDKGKVNPFAEYSAGANNTDTDNNSNNNTTDNSSKDNFLNTVGK
ncbi:MAG: hypothetical protein ACI4U9_03640 [Clostridia bacterium]